MHVNSSAEPDTRKRWKDTTLFLVTVGLLVVCGLMVMPFLPAITGAIVLATVTAGPYDRLKARVRNASLAASLALVAVVLSIVLPSTLVLAGVGQQALGMVNAARDGSAQRTIVSMLDRHPKIGTILETGAAKVDLGEVTRSAGGVLASWLGGLLSNSLGAFVQVVIMLFLLFFLYRDRQQALDGFRRLLPLDDREIDHLFRRIGDTINAAVLGRIMVASVQAVLAGLAYWVLGVPGALFWALATLAMSCIPGLGAFLVWLPIAIYLGLTDHWAKAFLMTAWGGLVVSTIDNVLFPVLVGSRMRQHTVPIFISVLGGILLFGVPGLALGPVILTVVQSLLQIWRERTVAPANEVG
jgi:predicted PurR-regulated permease PerM